MLPLQVAGNAIHSLYGGAYSRFGGIFFNLVCAAQFAGDLHRYLDPLLNIQVKIVSQPGAVVNAASTIQFNPAGLRQEGGERRQHLDESPQVVGGEAARAATGCSGVITAGQQPTKRDETRE